jgi:hypothetical protein
LPELPLLAPAPEPPTELLAGSLSPFPRAPPALEPPAPVPLAAPVPLLLPGPVLLPPPAAVWPSPPPRSLLAPPELADDTDATPVPPMVSLLLPPPPAAATTGPLLCENRSRKLEKKDARTPGSRASARRTLQSCGRMPRLTAAASQLAVAAVLTAGVSGVGFSAGSRDDAVPAPAGAASPPALGIMALLESAIANVNASDGLRVGSGAEPVPASGAGDATGAGGDPVWPSDGAAGPAAVSAGASGGTVRASTGADGGASAKSLAPDADDGFESCCRGLGVGWLAAPSIAWSIVRACNASPTVAAAGGSAVVRASIGTGAGAPARPSLAPNEEDGSESCDGGLGVGRLAVPPNASSARGRDAAWLSSAAMRGSVAGAGFEVSPALTAPVSGCPAPGDPAGADAVAPAAGTGTASPSASRRGSGSAAAIAGPAAA